jgi:hypothetical protein
MDLTKQNDKKNFRFWVDQFEKVRKLITDELDKMVNGTTEQKKPLPLPK